MWPLFKIVNFIYLLVSSYVWVAFLLPGNIVPVVVGLFMVVCFALGKFKFQATPRIYVLMGVLMLYAIYSTYIIDVKYGIFTLVSYFPAILLFGLDKNHQKELLSSITTWVGILLAVSLTFYLINFVIPLPHTTFLPSQLEGRYASFDNYVFFVQCLGYQDNSFLRITRFSGPFLEPGHMSVICSMLIFANRFDFKKNKWMWVLLSCVIISFSLAGYVMLIIGLCMNKIKSIVSMFGILAFIVSGWLFVTVIWNDGVNPVNVLIVERLELDNEKGIKGNNRTFKKTDHYFKQCVDDGTIWLGVRSLENKGDKIRGAGFKIFLLRYGVIGAAFVALIYLLLINPKANKRYSYSFFIFICIVFLQRAYPSWYSWLLPYVLGIGAMRGEKFAQVVNLRGKRKSKRGRRTAIANVNVDEKGTEENSEESKENNPALEMANA